VRLLPLALLLAAAPAAAQGAPTDSLAAGDSLAATAGPALPPAAPALDLGVPRAAPAEGGLEAPVAYAARDSLRIVLAPRDSLAGGEAPEDVVALYGETRATYETATIQAAQLRYQAAAETIDAEPLASDSGAVGLPQFADGEESFTGRRFTYNLKTRRGRVVRARTQIQDGYLLGGVLKQQDAHVVFAEDVAYTTCSLDHPHYAVEAGRMKVVDGERVYTGPIQLKLLGIPMPVFLPFGYIPTAEGRRSGPLPVTYGQESGYGLYLGNLGWYWAGTEYLDGQVAGKVGTQGSFEVRGSVRYNKRYAYGGEVGLSYGRLRSGEPTDPTFALSTPVGVRWSHNQTFPGGQRLTASVNIDSRSRRAVAEDVSTQISQSTSSSVSYQQAWPSVGRSLNVSGRVFQNFAGAGSTTLNLPTLSFRQQREFPFRRGRDDRWYEKVSVSYDARATNAFQYTPYADSLDVSPLAALFSRDAFVEGTCDPDAPDGACDRQRFDYEVVQTVPVQANFSVPRFNLTFGPSLNYTETWAGDRALRTVEDGAVVRSQEPGFTAVRRFEARASVATEFFGTFPVRVGRVDGLRHVVRPRASLSFEPDYSGLGFVREVEDPETGRVERYAIHPTIPVGPTRTLSFSVDNAFLARTARVDSTGEVQRETSQILDLGLSGGYNFAAEAEPWRNLNARATSEVFGVRAAGNATYSFYADDVRDEAGNLVTYLSETGRPVRLTSAGLRLSRSFQSGRGRGADVRPVMAAPPGAVYDPAQVGPQSATVGFLDYSAPWSFSLDVTVAHRPGAATPTTATLNVNQFNARLTPGWSVTGSTGLDLVSLEPTVTRLGFRRDLHCWEMAVNWQPIGRVKAFSVSLYVKSGYLRDFLRLDVPRSVSRALPLGAAQIPGL
jgi:hypothetical protein